MDDIIAEKNSPLAQSPAREPSVRSQNRPSATSDGINLDTDDQFAEIYEIPPLPSPQRTPAASPVSPVPHSPQTSVVAQSPAPSSPKSPVPQSPRSRTSDVTRSPAPPSPKSPVSQSPRSRTSDVTRSPAPPSPKSPVSQSPRSRTSDVTRSPAPPSPMSTVPQSPRSRTSDVTRSPGVRSSTSLPPQAIPKRGSSVTSHEPLKLQSPRRSSTPRSKSPTKSSIRSENSVKGVISPKVKQADQKSLSVQSERNEDNIIDAVSNLEPQGKSISDHVEELTKSIKNLSKSKEGPVSEAVVDSNIDKIANMSKILTNEANALRQSIKCLCDDIARTKEELNSVKEDVNFPYHLFLIELIINKIHMKCECFDIDYNNLVISATFLGKQPIILYDSSYGKIDNFSKLNVGKSTLFAMTYDKICSVKEFEVILKLTKQPPCSSCVTKIGETHMDLTPEFVTLREELCNKWTKEQPKDNILCTTSSPLSKNLYYLSCGDSESRDSIGVIEVTARLSFLGKEITTAFSASPKPQGTSFLLKQDNGMTMYSCQKVEMDDQGKILLDEDVFSKKDVQCGVHQSHNKRSESPTSQISSISSSKRSAEPVIYSTRQDGMPKYDEIFTKMNVNELKIRIPKSTKVERMGKYDKIQELCSCESTPYNTGDQVQFEMPQDICYPDKMHNTYSSNLKYTYTSCDRTIANKDRKVINVTPSNCPAPVDMEKMIHPLKDVFILKIGKKLETKDKKTDLEIELVTPKAPSEKVVENVNTNISAQCSSNDLKKKVSKTKQTKKKGKAKDKAKGKGNAEKSKKQKGKK